MARCMVLLLLVVAGGYSTAVPTEQQLVWADDELTAIGHFNMGTFEGCGIGSTPLEGEWTGRVGVPPPETFAPTNVDVEQWVAALRSFGAKHAVLVVSHGCGFNTFPSNTSFPEFGFEYNYSVKHSPWKGGKGDVAGEFVAACRKHGIRPGFYHGAMNNAFLNVVSGKVQGNPGPGQARITQEQYVKVLLANLRQLWTAYGPLAEVWFDGGYPEETADSIAALLEETQPDAVAFQGPGKNVVRWAGTESGHPKYPMWSTAASSLAAGSGEAGGAVFAPAEADTCLQTGKGEGAPYGGCWFYNEKMVPKSLPELVAIYHDSVGANANLLLDWSPMPSGELREDHVERYADFGNWIRGCYGVAVGEVSPPHNTSDATLRLPGGAVVDRVAILEDQRLGERIEHFTVYVDGVEAVSGSSVGHKRVVLLSHPTAAKEVRVVATAGAALRTVAAYNCSREPVPTGCNFETGFAYKIVPSITVKSLAVASASQCCEACRATPGCAVFVVSPTKQCTLLSANQGGSDVTGAVSGTPQ